MLSRGCSEIRDAIPPTKRPWFDCEKLFTLKLSLSLLCYTHGLLLLLRLPVRARNQGNNNRTEKKLPKRAHTHTVYTHTHTRARYSHLATFASQPWLCTHLLTDIRHNLLMQNGPPEWFWRALQQLPVRRRTPVRSRFLCCRCCCRCCCSTLFHRCRNGNAWG